MNRINSVSLHYLIHRHFIKHLLRNLKVSNSCECGLFRYMYIFGWGHFRHFTMYMCKNGYFMCPFTERYTCTCTLIARYTCTCTLIERYTCTCTLIARYTCTCTLIERYTCTCILIDRHTCICTLIERYTCICTLIEKYTCSYKKIHVVLMCNC